MEVFYHFVGINFFHYSSILFVPYILLYKQLKEKQFVSLLLLTLIILALSFGIITLLADVFIEKSSGYAVESKLIETKFGTGIGFLLKLSLYVGLAVTLIKGSKLDVIFFVLPLILIKILIIPYPLLGRVEIFFSVSFLLLLTQDAVKGWQRKVSREIIVALSLLNVYGTLQSISEGDAQPNDLAHSLSPYITYHTLFDESQTDEDSITY